MGERGRGTERDRGREGREGKGRAEEKRREGESAGLSSLADPLGNYVFFFKETFSRYLEGRDCILLSISNVY